MIAVAGGRSNRVSLLDIESGEEVAPAIEHPSIVFAARFSPDGNRIITSCRDGHARIIDWRTGEILVRGLDHEADILNACFADEGRTAITIGNDKLLKVWCSETGLQNCPPIFIGDGMRHLDVNDASSHAIVSGRIPKGCSCSARSRNSIR